MGLNIQREHHQPCAIYVHMSFWVSATSLRHEMYM